MIHAVRYNWDDAFFQRWFDLWLGRHQNDTVAREKWTAKRRRFEAHVNFHALRAAQLHFPKPEKFPGTKHIRWSHGS